MAICAAAAAAVALPASAGAARSSLPRLPGPDPGPRILYKKPPKPAPQLRNRGIWKAKPLLISGAAAYRRGEFVYQDFLFDDHGATGVGRDPGDPRTGNDAFSAPNGTYTYPTDVPAYRNNVADLVELRIRAKRRFTAFRLTFSSMTDPGLVATTIALGNSAAPRELPFGAGASAPARRWLFVRGRRAVVLGAATNKRQGGARARVSKRRKQITVRVPRRSFRPGRRTIRIAAATGLWDKTAGAYLRPGSEANATTPGGAGGLEDPTAIFNVAFRFGEPLPDVQDIPGAVGNTAWWRDKAQGAALAAGDLSPFFANVSFRKLRRGRSDPMLGEPKGTPARGAMNRIFTTRLSGGQGVDYAAPDCGTTQGCAGQYQGRLQPYAIYVPEEPRPTRGYALTLLLHSLGATYNQFLGSNNQSQFGERGQGNIVVTTLSGGPDGWYYGRAGAEVFEVWADVAHRFRLDPRRSAIAGYSMGGYATYKLASQFPDLFAAGQPTVGPPYLGVGGGAAGSDTTPMLASLRHVPLRIWVGALDELVQIPFTTAHADAVDAAGLRYEFDVFPAADHFALAVNDEYGLAADFLGNRTVVRNPARVTYATNTGMDFPKLGYRGDRAYWLSGIRNRAAGLGELDAFSHGFGRGAAPVRATENGGGVLEGGYFGAMPFTSETQRWGAAPKQAKRNRLDLELGNVRRVRVDMRRARLRCDAKVKVTSDGPARVILGGCGRVIRAG